MKSVSLLGCTMLFIYVFIIYTAKCKFCRKDISVDNMGESALKSHVSTGNHSKLVKEHNEARNSLPVFISFYRFPVPLLTVLNSYFNTQGFISKPSGNSYSTFCNFCRNQMGIKICFITFLNASMS